MKKAVFFDWDGTLSFDGNHMSPENRKAIALYERLGFQQKDFPEYLISEDEEQTSIYMELRKN